MNVMYYTAIFVISIAYYLALSVLILILGFAAFEILKDFYDAVSKYRHKRKLLKAIRRSNRLE